MTPIEEYIKQAPEGVQERLSQIRELISSLVPQGVETIGYGMPTFKLNGQNLIHFAIFKNHIGLYPTPSAIVAFANELKDYKTSKGAIQLPLDRPIPYALIKEIVRHRIRELSI